MGIHKALVVIGLIVLVITTGFSNTIITYSQQAYRNLLVFYIPGGGLDKLLNAMNASHLTPYVVNLEDDYHATFDYYVYWVLTGSRPDNTSINLTSSQVDTEIIASLWANATLVDFPVVDPTKHPSALNPLVNIESLHVPPVVFKIPVNGSVYWEDLDTDVTATLEESGRLVINLTRFRASASTINITASRTLGPIVVNTTEDTTVRYRGLFNLLFYVVEVENNTVVVFSPGSLNVTGFASGNFTGFNDVYVHWSMLLRYRNITNELTSDAIDWWITQIYDSTSRFFRRAIIDTKNPVIFSYMPELVVVRDVLGEEWYNNTTESFYRNIINELVSYANTFKPDYLAVFIIGDQGKYYAVFTSPILPALNETVNSWSFSQLVAVLLTYSNASPFQSTRQLIASENLSECVTENNQLKQNVTDLTNRLDDVTKQLSSCESDLVIYKTNVSEIENTMKRLSEVERTVTMYMVSGVAITVAVSIVLGFIAIRVASKKPSE